MSVGITGKDLDRAAFVAVARDGARVELDPAAGAHMLETRVVVERALADGAAVYGLSTAVGVLKRVALADDAAAYSARVLRTHHVAQGPPAPLDVVRGTMLRLLNSFASGVPGVRPALAERLVRALNDDERPVVRTLGSIGQADLAPMADLALALFRDMALAAGEGLALVSSNAFATASTALATHDSATLMEWMTAAGALSLEALCANRSLLHPAIAVVRPYAGLGRSLTSLRGLLEGSFLWADGAARSLQDPLTFRNLPQLLGAANDAHTYLDGQLAVELNASDSNPIVVAGEPRPISVANFEMLPLVTAVDHLRVALASVLTASTERAVKLLERPWSGLPTGLAPYDDTSDPGLAYLGIVSQSLAAEARLLAQPVSLEMASTAHAEGIEDRATMAPLAARRLAEQVALGRRIVAIELVVAAQAVDLRGSRPLGRGTAEVRAFVRGFVPGLMPGDVVPDVEPLVVALVHGARSAVGGPTASIASAAKAI
jgi:histidine ammonia-lyase